MGISFKNHSGSFRSTPRPWDHLPPEPGAPMCAPRSDPLSLPTRNSLFQPLRFTPKVIPLAPKFKEKDESCRDFLEHYTKLKPNWGEATGAEGPLPSTPSPPHRRERVPFGEVSYMIQKKPHQQIPKRHHPIRKLSKNAMESKFTPTVTPMEQARIDRMMKHY